MITLFPFKQSDSSRCGPACVKMILSYYGIDVTEDDICTHCDHTYELGCTNEAIQKALDHYGIASIIKTNCDLADIEYWIRHHIPVIIDWFTPGINPGPEDMPNGHASIIVGIDRERVYMLDPENGQHRSILREEFMRVWFDWSIDPHITPSTQLIIRLMIIPYPHRLNSPHA